MNLEKLVETCSVILAQNQGSLVNATAYKTLDARTVRYYDFEGLLSKPTKRGKTNQYTSTHVQQIVLIKLLQSMGLSLSQIKQKFNTQSINSLSIETGVDQASLEAIVKELGGNEMTLKEGPETMSNTKQTKPVTNPWKNGEIRPSRLTATVSALAGMATEASEMEKAVNLGSSFVFFKTDNEDLAKKVHNLLYGQKAKGQTKQSVVYVENGQTLNLPCYMIAAPKVPCSIGAIVPDKDIYQESSGVASLFIFLPKCPKETIQLAISLDGILLSNEEVDLDENGCGLLRVATHVAGNYSVTAGFAGDTVATCTFQAARYELVPFTVTGKVTKSDGKLNVQLQGEKYGVAYEGSATATLVQEGSKFIEIINIDFLEGMAKVAFTPTKGDGALSVRVALHGEDAKLIANVPLTGAKQSEREDSEIGSLGRVVSCSMLHMEGSENSRGLFLNQGAYTNSPVSIESHIADTATLILNDSVNDLVVVVEDSHGLSKVHELGNKKKGSKVSVKLTDAYSVLRIGAFIANEPWEGHAIVLKKNNDKAVAMEVAERVNPGSELEIKLTSKNPASVLIKVCDKRLRASYEPMTKIASSAKEWLAKAYQVTGFVASKLPKMMMNPLRVSRGWETLGVARYDDFGSSRSIRKSMFGNSQLSMRALSPNDGGGSGHVMMASTGGSFGMSGPLNDSDNDVVYSFAEESPTANYFSAADRSVELSSAINSFLGNTGFAGPVGVSGCQGYSGQREVVKTRTTIEDAIFCDLITVDGERIVKIKLPDVIGFFDVKAFCVSGLDWQEIGSSLRVEKEVYVESFIPKFAHPEDRLNCRAVVVNAVDTAKITVTVDGKDVPFEVSSKPNSKLKHVSWEAKPGCHEVSVTSGENEDKIMRVVEAPGEEIVLSQELMILKKGKKFELDGGVMSIAVVPSMEEDVNLAIQVLTDYTHACCEQTSAKLVAACFAVVCGSDTEKSNAYKSIIAAEARFKAMAFEKGFYYYPGSSFNYWASKVAGKRIGMISSILPSKLPSDVKRAVNSLVEMGKVADAYEGNDGSGSWYQNAFTQTEMERSYFEGNFSKAEEKAKAFASGKIEGSWNQGEAAFCAASLLKSKKFDIGIDLANFVAKSMKGGCGWHGTCELLAYMFMVSELCKSGVVSNGKSSKVKVNGKSVSIEKAMETKDIESVEAVDGPVALRINRLEKINLFERASSLQIKVDLVGPTKRTFKPSDLVKLNISIVGGYQNGDVACICLPQSLSKIVSGAQVKKFQVDFAGKDSVEIELIATEHTDNPQRWAAVVRNMYESDRIGSVGLMTVEVKK